MNPIKIDFAGLLQNHLYLTLFSQYWHFYTIYFILHLVLIAQAVYFTSPALMTIWGLSIIRFNTSIYRQWRPTLSISKRVFNISTITKKRGGYLITVINCICTTSMIVRIYLSPKKNKNYLIFLFTRHFVQRRRQ